MLQLLLVTLKHDIMTSSLVMLAGVWLLFSVSSATLTREICLLEPQTGICQNRREIRYFYNVTSSSCQQFVYSGCLGNDNNFQTLEICLAVCAATGPSLYNPTSTAQLLTTAIPQAASAPAVLSQTPSIDVHQFCELDADFGLSCTDNVTVWFHNRLTKQCQQFVFGGCLGNQNRFPTQVICQSVCLTGWLSTTALQQSDLSQTLSTRTSNADCQQTNCGNKHCQSGFTTDLYGCTLCLCEDPCEESPCPDNMHCIRYSQSSRQTSCIEQHSGSCGDPRNCSLDCGTLGYVVDADGCSLCQCRQSVACPTRLGNCSLSCLYGLNKDSSGCETCSCFDPCQGVNCVSDTEVCTVTETTVCHSDMCHMEYTGQCSATCLNLSCANMTTCLYGYAKNNSTGCNTCQCFEPCQNVTCSVGSSCQAQTHVVCHGTQCNNVTTALCVSDCAEVMCSIELGLSCPYGLDTDSNGCEMCQCYEPCRGVTCPANTVCQPSSLPIILGENLKTRVVYTTSCIEMSPTPSVAPPSSSTPTTTTTTTTTRPAMNASASLTVPVPTFSPSTTANPCHRVMCRMYCEYGWAIDINTGCDICQCFNPCQNVTCRPGSLCQPLQQQIFGSYIGVCQHIEGSTPQLTTTTPQPGRQVVVIGIFKVFADFSIVKNIYNFKQQIAREFASKILHTESANINITQLKAGSILVYFDVFNTSDLPTLSILSSLQVWTTSVIFLYDGVEYQAKLVKYVQNSASESKQEDSKDLLLVVLIPVLVPICLFIIIIVIVVTCKIYKTDHELLSNSRTSSVFGVSDENLAKGADSFHHIVFNQVKASSQTTTSEA